MSCHPVRAGEACDKVKFPMRLLAFVLLPALLLPAQTFYKTSDGPYFSTVADLDGDGNPDAILPCRGELKLPTEKAPANDMLTVLYTAGSREPHLRRDYRIGYGPYTAVAADLDGDGRKDVAVANFQANDGRDLSILWGAGGSEWLSPAVHLRVEGAPFTYGKNFTAAGAPVYPAPGLTSVTVVDFNRDGRPDLVAVAWSSDFFVVFENLGGRKFRQHRFPLLPGPRDVAAADFTGDGIVDLAFTIYSCNMIEVWKGDGRGGFTPWRKFYSQGMIPYHLKSGDIDRDGRVDLAVGNRGPSDNVAVFLNKPDSFHFAGSYSPGTPKKGEMTADEIRDVLLYDEDGDGVLDLAAVCHRSHKLVRWRGTGSAEFGRAFRDRETVLFDGKGPRSLSRLEQGLAVAFYDSSEFAVVPHRRR